MKKYIILLLTLPLVLSSCLKEDRDIFGKLPGERMAEYLANANKVLSEAKNGWLVEYYSGRDAKYGGVVVYMKFDGNENVTISSEASWQFYGKDITIADAAKMEESSIYEFKEDYGPTLNFTTYNKLFHIYSEPGVGIGEDNMGMGGDAEFIIMSVAPDKVVLRGKKGKNIIVMTPLPIGDWSTKLNDYLTNVDVMEQMPSYQLRLQDKIYGAWRVATSGYNARYFVFDLPISDIREPFTYTESGIKFYEPITIDGVTISEMKWQDGGFVDEKSGAVIETVTSRNTFDIKTSNVKAITVNVTVTPTIRDEYYFIGAYPKADEATKSEAEIIASLMKQIYTVDDLSSGESTKTVRVKELTEYVACAFGVNLSPGGTVASATGLFKSAPFTTLADIPMTDAYKAWIGTWTVTSTSSELSGEPITLDVVIGEEDRNSSYSILGWSIAGVRNDYAGIGKLAADGTMTFADWQKLGMEAEYTVTWLSLSTLEGEKGTVSVGNIPTPMTCMLGADKQSATASGYKGKVGSGAKFEVVSMEYFAVLGVDDLYLFNPAPGYTSQDFPMGPYTMTKKSNATSEFKIRAIEPGARHTDYVLNLKKYTQVHVANAQ